MQAISADFSRALLDNSSLLVKATLALADGTKRELTGDDIVSLSYEQATSSDQSFDVGSAVIGKCDVTLNNHDHRFDAYDFTGAIIAPYVGKSFGDAETRGVESDGLSVTVRDGGEGDMRAVVRLNGDELTSEGVARLGIIRWYVADRLVATGASCDVDYGTTVECRLEA